MLRIRHMMVAPLALAVVATLAPRSTFAQTGTCVYARCALSIQQHPPRVVQGVAATPVADFGFFAPRIDLLANGSDSARLHYEAFRRDYNRGAAFKLIGFTAGIASFIVFSGNPRANHGAALGIFALAVPSEIAGLVILAKAQGQLEQSIAAYNRTLPDTP